MALDMVVAPLLRVPVLAGLKPLQLTEIARNAERVKFRGGDVITLAGSLGDGAYLIVSGEAERQPDPGSSEPAEPVAPGSLIGELAMLVEHVYGATVVASGRVQCLKLTREALHEQMREDDALARHFRLLIEERLTHAAAELRKILDDLNGFDASSAANEAPAAEEAGQPTPLSASPQAPALKGPDSKAGGSFAAIFPAATGTGG